MSVARIIIRINPPTDLRIVITAGYIIESSLGVVVIASVPQGVDAGQIAGGGEELAPGVVGVGGDGGSAGVEDAGYIALQVGQVVVGDGVRGGTGFVGEGVGIAALIVEEFQLFAVVILGDQLAALPEVLVLHAVNGLGKPEAVSVVGVGGGQVFGGIRGTCQPSAVYPGEGVLTELFCKGALFNCALLYSLKNYFLIFPLIDMIFNDLHHYFIFIIVTFCVQQQCVW